MPEQTKKFIYLLPLLLLFGGCSSLLSKMYDIKTIDGVDKKACEKFIATIDLKGIDAHALYIDSNTFNAYRKTPVSRQLKKDFSQPGFGAAAGFSQVCRQRPEPLPLSCTARY